MPPDNPNDNHYNSAPDLGQAFDKIFDELTAKIERRLSKEALAAEFAIIETKFTKTMDGYAKPSFVQTSMGVWHRHDPFGHKP